MSQKYTDPYSGKRKSLRHANQCAHKRRLRALMRATGNWYPAPVGWSNYECTTEHWQHPLAPAEGAWIVNYECTTEHWQHPLAPAEGAWIVEYSRPRYYKQYRTMCNRKLRRRREVDCGSGAWYRKATEFWWTVE